MTKKLNVLFEASEVVTEADQGFILLDGTDAPLIVTDAMGEVDLEDYLGSMTLFTLAALKARLDVLSTAVNKEIVGRRPAIKGNAFFGSIHVGDKTIGPTS